MGPKANVPDALVHKWVRGLPPGLVTLLSLLGQKSSGKCEWSYYSFYDERRSFQAWLDQHYGELGIRIVEHATVDGVVVPTKVLERVSAEIVSLSREGRAVVVMD